MSDSGESDLNSDEECPTPKKRVKLLVFFMFLIIVMNF